MTRTGKVVKSFQNDAWLEISGNRRSMEMLPSIAFTMATPAVITTNTMAKPTDNADVYLNESNTVKVQTSITIAQHYHTTSYRNENQ